MANPSDLKRLLDALPLLRESGVMRVRVGDIEIDFGHLVTSPGVTKTRYADDCDQCQWKLQGDNHPHIVVDPTLGPYEGYTYDSAELQSAIDNLTISRDTDTVDVDNETTHETSTDSPAMDDDVRERVDLDLAHVED